MCEDSKQRIIIKKGNGIPTIPVSSDHRNGDWIATDIYEGEQYLDLDSGIEYTRVGSEIMQYGTGAHKVYKAIIDQSGTTAPVETLLISNSIGALVWSYVGVGHYRLTLTGAFTADKVYIHGSNITKQGHEIIVNRANANYLNIMTYDSGVLSNGVLTIANINVEIY